MDNESSSIKCIHDLPVREYCQYCVNDNPEFTQIILLKGRIASLESELERTKRFSKKQGKQLELCTKAGSWWIDLSVKDDLVRDIIGCEPSVLEDEMTICIHYDTLNNIVDKYLSPPITEKE